MALVNFFIVSESLQIFVYFHCRDIKRYNIDFSNTKMYFKV